MREIKAGDFVRAQELLRLARDAFNIPDVLSVRIAITHHRKFQVPFSTAKEQFAGETSHTFGVEEIELQRFTGAYRQVIMGYGPKTNMLVVFEKGTDNE